MNKVFIILTLTLCLWAGMAFRVLTIAPDSSGGGASSSKTAGTSFSVSPSPSTTSRLLVIAAALDNVSATADGDNGDVTGATATINSTNYSLTKAVQYTNVQTGAGTGATVAIYYVVFPTAPSSQPSVVVSFSGSVTAKVVAYRLFSIGAGASVAVASPLSFALDGSTLSPNFSLSGLTSREYLFVYADAMEAASTATTPPTGWSAFANTSTSGTTGGGGASNMSLLASYRIATTTTQDYTSVTTPSSDQVAGIVALYETTGAPARNKKPDFFKAL